MQSLSIAPVAVDADAKCTPSVETPALVTQAELDPQDALWETKARACFGQGRDTCPGGARCSNVAPVNGWRQCVSRYGFHECLEPDPDTPYTEQFVFYQVSEDKRTCSPCTCGTPEGDSCMSQISLYSNPGCSGVPFWSKPVTSDLNSCENVPAGVALMSKEATEPIYTPGTCAPFGGNPVGSVVGSAPVTVCCLPLP